MELPIVDFIRQVLSEVNPNFETRPGTAYYDMFIAPQQLMLQPLNNTMSQLLVSQSVKQILAQPDPDAYPETDVDDVVSNVYVTRDAGEFASGSVRVYYATPLDKEYTAFTAEFIGNDLSFFNSTDVSITAAQMALQTEGSLYYMDVAVRAQLEGEAYIVDAEVISTFLNDKDAVRVTNLSKTQSGRDRETNTEVLTRAENSIGVRDLETIKGINAILTSNYTFITSLYSIGMGDPEMQRDILYNVHVGGKTDVYIKTPSLTEGSKDILSMDFDSTREIDQQIHVQMARSASDTELSPETGTPEIVANSVVVKEDIVETAASVTTIAVPPVTGVNLVGKEYIRIKFDSGTSKLIKVAGAVPSQTQRFEIINSINASIGLNVASTSSGNRIKITSPTIGAGSSIELLAVGSPYNEGSLYLFDLLALPESYYGVVAETYIEGIDFDVDYVNGLIYQKPYPRVLPTILSGQEMINTGSGPTGTGQITQSGSNLFFESTIAYQFYQEPSGIKVRVGDLLTITEIAGSSSGTPIGDLPQSFVISKIDGGDITVAFPKLVLENLSSVGPFPITNINYKIVSNQTVIVDYKYHPISIDIGGQVLLSDGLTRGVRPGRENYTITDTPFIDIVSIVEIDPQSGEVIGEPLNPPRGYGAGGYGSGGYGSGLGGDYEFRILAPRDRYSVFDDAIIILKPSALTLSYRVTYRWVPELVAVHNLCRTDSERVTGADVLPRHYVPCFVDITIGIRRDPTNINTPANEDLAVLVKDYVNGRTGVLGVAASDISKILEDQGVDTVQTPFNMIGTLYNTDGTSIILESQDILTFPDVTLAKDTIAYATKRIVHFLPNNIVVQEVS